MSKQDRQGVRTAADVERKYSLGDINDASKRSTKAEKQVSELDQRMNLFMSSVNKTIKDIQDRVNSFYPVGSIYISADAKNPSELFGGVWERIEDRFLLAASDTYPNMSTGGEAEHTLTIEELPIHNHQIHQWTWILSSGGNSGRYNIPGQSAGNGNAEHANEDAEYRTSYETGGNQAHNNMPPYLAVYVWRRIS